MTPSAPSCVLKVLPSHLQVPAAMEAAAINPANRPPVPALARMLGAPPQPMHIAVLTSKYWGPEGVDLTVGFLDGPGADLRARILGHMNAWSKMANVRFRASTTDPQVRITRGPTGYWSYLGTDILQIPPGQPTMNLQGFTMATPDREFYRVVRHETGHTLGAPHEHMRAALVARIDPQRAINYYGATQGWTPAMVQAQVLTPLDEGSFEGGTSTPDAVSIMTYQVPGEVTKDGMPIEGGTDIDELDYAAMWTLYPK